jgi:hypothetical protein
VAVVIAEGKRLAVGEGVAIGLIVGEEVTRMVDKGGGMMPGRGVSVAMDIGVESGAADGTGVALPLDKANQLIVATGNGATSSATRYRS